MEMATASPGRRSAELIGRRRERGVLDGLIQAVRGGESQALVVAGDPGIGKTALLDYVAGHAPGCRVVRAAGVQSEMELVFAGLHQVCAPMLYRLGRLPSPQADALGVAFGLAPGSAPDRFVLGLAVLNLLSDAAEEQPLICLVDDEQWLDRASAQVLAFVARRLGADSVGLVFGARVPSSESAALPRLMVEGLHQQDARALLGAALAWPLDARVRDQIVAETRGNPLALLEVALGVSPSKVAGGFGLPAAVPLTSAIEASFERRVAALPGDTRRLIQLAAADPLGDRSGGVRRSCPVPSSTCAFGRVSVRLAPRAAEYPSCAGGGDRSAGRPRSSRVAPCRGGSRAGRGRSCGARALREPSPGTGRPRRGGRVP